MNQDRDASGGEPKKWYRLSLIEILIVLLIIAILVALLRPGVQQASSGSVVFPVRVFVFDAVHGVPIEGAQVGITHTSGIYSLEDKTINLSRWPSSSSESDYLTAKTDEKGIALIDQKFYTGAGNRHPESSTHLPGAWVLVSAEGFGSMTIPVSNYSKKTARIREQGEIFVSIGLVPQQSIDVNTAE